MDGSIEIRGARVNNLKNISVNIPRDRLTVIAGVSGSGKSSLAFDTLYAEGQRRYVESLSAYARQFLGRKNKPECDFIGGIPPAIAIEQKVISRNPRSTVGTTTEVYEYLKLLFSRIGHTYSPISGQEVKKHSVEDIIQCTKTYSQGTKFAVLSPVRITAGRTLEQQLTAYIKQGYARLFVNSTFIRIEDYGEGKDPYLVIDRLSVDDSKDSISRLTDSLETALYEGDGKVRLLFLPSMITYDFSTVFEADGMTFEEPSDGLFSFNSAAGACPTCQGFGTIIGIDERLVIPDTSLSVYEGCVTCWKGEKMKEWKEQFCRQAAKDDFPIFTPYCDLTRAQRLYLWRTINAFFDMVKENVYKIQYAVMLSRFRGRTTCIACGGTRLRQEAEYVKIGGMSITNLTELSITRLKEWITNLSLPAHEQTIAERLLKEIDSRLTFLINVGLGYLTLARPSATLSGGESQRINLTKSIGSSLVGSLYILDEPSIGLHSRDTQRLITAIKELRDIGNTVVIVEHDEEIIRAADYIIDVGPDAGRLGGEIVFAGKADEALTEAAKEQFNRSHTIDYLTGREAIPTPTSRRAWTMAIDILGARMNNLKGIDVRIPLNVMTAVTGVSGSGKSSLIKGILYPALVRKLGDPCDAPGEHTAIEGDTKAIQHVEFVDQNPIGKSTRSNPATYVKAYDAIRELFARMPLAKQLGLTAQHFSFNADGGRCEECKGAGEIIVGMQFMADITLSCEACGGKRFKREVLDVTYHGKNIDDILNMTISEAMEFFAQETKEKSLCNTIIQRLKTLEDVGLGYIKVGQNSSSLSGGENQRVKLAYFIGREQQEPTLFFFDEPTTGLHFHDIKRLMRTFDALISRGHTIVVIEHNIDVIKCADYIIDLGPEGGNAGGQLIAAGTPEEVAIVEQSYTGQYLRTHLTPQHAKRKRPKR